MKQSSPQIAALVLMLVSLATQQKGFSEEPRLGTVPNSPTPMIIDTDMAIDDWLAILYLLQHPDVSIKAITVTGAGEAHCGPGVRAAQGLVALGWPWAIPVTCGQERPLRGDHRFPLPWRRDVDRVLDLPLPSNPFPPSRMDAAELLISTIRKSPRKMVLVTLGPLTNVAEALQRDPSIVKNLEMIYIMGGAVEVPGNLRVPGFTMHMQNTTAEWNLYVDPFATQVVFASGAPITLVPLDACNDVPFTLDFFNRLKGDHTTPAADFVLETVTVSDMVNADQYYFWDPLTAAIATDNELAVIERRAIAVEVKEGIHSGRTFSSPSGYPMRVCIGADRARFERLFLDTLNGRRSSVSIDP